LSPEGKESIKQIFNDRDAFSAHVEFIDDLGLWVRPAKRDQLLLLKWIYVATAQLDVESGDFSASDARKETIQ
jgi:hypothetical protein